MRPPANGPKRRGRRRVMTQSHGPVLLAYDGVGELGHRDRGGRAAPPRPGGARLSRLDGRVADGAARRARGAAGHPERCGRRNRPGGPRGSGEDRGRGRAARRGRRLQRQATARARGAQDVAHAAPGRGGPSRLAHRRRRTRHVRHRAGAARQRVDRSRSSLSTCPCWSCPRRLATRKRMDRCCSATTARTRPSARSRSRASYSIRSRRSCSTSGSRGSPRLPPSPL